MHVCTFFAPAICTGCECEGVLFSNRYIRENYVHQIARHNLTRPSAPPVMHPNGRLSP